MIENIRASGAKSVEVYIDGPGHATYMIADVSDFKQLWRITEPLPREKHDVQFIPIARFEDAYENYMRAVLFEGKGFVRAPREHLEGADRAHP